MKKLIILLALAIVQNSYSWDCIVHGLKNTDAQKYELNIRALNTLNEIEQLRASKEALELEKALGT